MILGIYGFQDAGKTVLVEKLVAALVKKGYSVASVKHTPHRKSIDCEGKDTWRHWLAGSDPVVFSSEIETSVIKHSKMPLEDIAEMIMREFRPDVLLIEGCKEGPFPKVAIGGVERRRGTVLSNPPMSKLVRFVETEVEVEKVLAELPGLDCRKCGFDCAGLARAIVGHKRRMSDCKELSDLGVSVVVGERRVPTGKFASKVVDSTVRGLLSGLKGYEPGKKVEIRLDAKRGPTRRRRKA
jgi:molybdopterin-guanine dinucleotide biosynthesis protein MobB